MTGTVEVSEKLLATYEVEGDSVSVTIKGIGTKETFLGDMPPATLASMLANEIIREVQK